MLILANTRAKIFYSTSSTDWLSSVFSELLLTSRERDERRWLHKLALLVQKVSWVKGVWCLPFVLVIEHRCHVEEDCNTLEIEIIMTIHEDTIWQ